jgi:acetyltransferase-like isoleucine patch superfamily enzyme
MQATLDLPSVPEEFRFGGQVADIRAGNFVLLGSHTVILPGTTLPEGFASAAHTVVRCRKYEEWTLYAGFECKQVCIRTHNELQARKSDLIARASKAQQHSQD